MPTVLADIEALRAAIAQVVKLVDFPKFGSAAQAIRIRTEPGMLVVSANSISAQVRAEVPVEAEDELGYDVLVGFPPLLAIPALGRVEIAPSGTLLQVRTGKTKLGSRTIAGDPTIVADPQLPDDLAWLILPPDLKHIAGYGGEAHPYFSVLPYGIYVSDMAGIIGYVPLENAWPLSKIDVGVVNGMGMQFAIGDSAVYLHSDSGISALLRKLEGQPIEWKMIARPAVARLSADTGTLRQWAEYAHRWAGQDYPRIKLHCDPAAGLRVAFAGAETEADYIIPSTIEQNADIGDTFRTDMLLKALGGMPATTIVEFAPLDIEGRFFLRLVAEGHQVSLVPVGG